MSEPDKPAHRELSVEGAQHSHTELLPIADPIVEVSGLTVHYGDHRILRDISFRVHRGETVAIVGPSGCGKTTILRAVLGMLDDSARVSGSLRIGGEEMSGRPERDFRAVRGTVLGYVGQDPYGAMDPLMSVATNIAQGWRITGRKPPHHRIVEDTAALGLTAPARLRERPFAWSGGMLQRAAIVTGRALDPVLVLADEPTSALDDVNAHRVLAALTRPGATLLIVSHDRELVAQYADRVYSAENGTLRETTPIPPPDAEAIAAREPKPIPAPPLISAEGLTKRYASGGGLPPTDIQVRPGEIVGIAGASGSGKSTLLRVLAGAEQPSEGTLRWNGAPGAPPAGQAGLIFQDAVGSLAPRRPLYRSLTEPLLPRLRDRLPRAESLAITRAALDRVGLGDIDPTTRPGRLSGGQAQRVAIARALVADVRLLLADEPTAALDDATAQRILDLLRDMADEGRAVVVVSHSRRALRRIADNIITLGEDPRTPTLG
ncbi:ABC transporter ATP-binding protein [Nocardia carnea]|uniref:ABC transporter ATP-binding protein n=1 Tax=Nocardia carnea TaxID=37328 RepID=A0ABW7TUW5_9NOCA|nr:ATP-binding cassette domain-containing protein [Nocardia carnea]